MKQKKLKICHVITRMIVGGAQENTLLTVIGLIDKGHEITLVTGFTNGPEGKLLEQSELVKKYDIKVMEVPHLVRSINPIFDLLAFISLRNIFSLKAFDVVHTHSSKAGIIGRAAACAIGVPFIAHTIHGQAFHKYEKKWKNWLYIKLEHWAARRCHQIYAVSQAMITQCLNEYISIPDKYKVVYSGMELEPFLSSKPDEELRRKLEIPENVPIIGSIARLFPLKGYDYLISTAVKVLEKHPNAIFLIVGDGILKDKLQKQILDFGISSNFIFAGLIPPSEIYKYISIMDFLVHLSLREGLPRTVVQALASGKPAIGFDLDGTPEVIINNKTGYLIQPKDIDGVANAVIELIEKPELAVRMGKAGKKLVSKKFDWHEMVNILEKEYINGITKYLGWKKS